MFNHLVIIINMDVCHSLSSSVKVNTVDTFIIYLNNSKLLFIFKGKKMKRVGWKLYIESN
jgi:hypothetical protein